MQALSEGMPLADSPSVDDIAKRLADEQSCFVFDKVIEYKLSGRIQPLLDCQTPEPANWHECIRGTVLPVLRRTAPLILSVSVGPSIADSAHNTLCPHF